MGMTCDNEEWTPDSKEVDDLSLFDTEQRSIVTIGYVDNIDPWQVGKAAGFSGGTTTDEAKRRSNWASAASKATKLNRKVLPHIVALRERLVQFRSDGGGPKSVSWKDKLARCEWLITYGTPSESLRAVELHNKMQGLGDSTPTAKDVVSLFIAKVGSAAAREGLTLLGAKNLANLVPNDIAEAEAEELCSLNAVDFDDRLQLLEARL